MFKDLFKELKSVFEEPTAPPKTEQGEHIATEKEARSIFYSSSGSKFTSDTGVVIVGRNQVLPHIHNLNIESMAHEDRCTVYYGKLDNFLDQIKRQSQSLLVAYPVSEKGIADTKLATNKIPFLSETGEFYLITREMSHEYVGERLLNVNVQRRYDYVNDEKVLHDLCHIKKLNAKVCRIKSEVTAFLWDDYSDNKIAAAERVIVYKEVVKAIDQFKSLGYSVSDIEQSATHINLRMVLRVPNMAADLRDNALDKRTFCFYTKGVTEDALGQQQYLREQARAILLEHTPRHSGDDALYDTSFSIGNCRALLTSAPNNKNAAYFLYYDGE